MVRGGGDTVKEMLIDAVRLVPDTLLRSHPAARRIACIALLSYTATACRTWQVESAPIPTALATPVPMARVSVADGSSMTLRRARVVSDSIVGWSTDDDSLRVAIPLAAVRSVELVKVDVERSVGWGLLLLFLTGIAVVLSAIVYVTYGT
jgi:hypothetical protein